MQRSTARFFAVSTPRSKDDPEAKLKRRRWKLQSIPLVVFFILFLCVFISFMKDHNKIEALRYYNDNVTQSKNPNLIVSLSGMNTENYEMSVSAFLNRVPEVVMNNDTTRITTPFRIQVGASAVVFNENTSFVKSPMTSKVPLLTGSLARYPFDTYLMKLEIQAVTGTSQFNGLGYSPIENFEFVVLMPDDFSWTYNVRQTVSSDFPSAVFGGGAVTDPKNGLHVLTVEITRDFNIYMALVFVGIWAVTIAVGYIGSMSVIWKRRAPDNPVIFVSALFAVPTFRNTVPGKPPYGCLFDVLCTYFSIGVILSFLLLVAFAYMRKPKEEKKPKRNDDDTIPVATLDANGNVVIADVADVADAGDAGGGDAGGDAGVSDAA